MLPVPVHRSKCNGQQEHGRCDAVLVITHLSPGGTLEMFLLIAQELRALGLRVALVAIYRGRGSALDDDGCDVLIDREALGISGYARAFVELIVRMWQLGPAAVLTFQPAANILGAIAGFCAGARTRIASQHQASSAVNAMLRWIDRVLGSVGLYSGVITVSRSVQQSFVAYPTAYNHRMRVIPNAIHPVAPRTARAVVRRSLGIRENAVLLISVGRLSKEKNVIKTIAGATRVPDVNLVLVGDGPERKDIESYVAGAGLNERVLLLGHVNHQRAVDILFASDVFVQLSEWEGRSLALMEALLARVPVLASDIPAQREALTLPDGTLAGLLCDQSNETAIYKAVEVLAGNERLRTELASRAEVIARAFDPARMGREYALMLSGK